MTNVKFWQKAKISDFGVVITGKTPPTKRQEYYGDKYPFITPTDISDGLYTVRTARFLSEKGRELQKRYLLPPKTVCYTCIASIGKICITTEPSFTNQQINSIIVDHEHYDYRFVYHLLRHETERIKGLASGAAAPIINKSAFSDIEVMVPPLPTQRKIAAMLSAYDDLIENNTRRIALLEELAQHRYREWFVRFRFPGHADVPLVESALGPIPQGWEVAKLGEIAQINRASLSNGNAPEIIKYINISSVSPGRIDLIETIPFIDAPGRARRLVQHGDIIWSTVRPNRKSYTLILDPEPELIVSTGFAVITPTKLPYSYLYNALTTDEFVGYLTNHATGSAYPAVNTSDFENAAILLPTSKIADAFHHIVADFYSERQILHRKNTLLRTTRDLLLPRLISGAVAVGELEIAI